MNFWQMYQLYAEIKQCKINLIFIFILKNVTYKTLWNSKGHVFQTKAAFKAIRCRYPSQKAQHKYKKKKCMLCSSLLIVTSLEYIMVYSKLYLSVKLFSQISHESFQ